jgi:hypothetical protein
VNEFLDLTPRPYCADSTKATLKKVIETLRRLPPQQLEEVIQFIDFIAGRRGSSATISEASDLDRTIMALRGRGKGERLVEKLLQSRRGDQRRDEPKGP